MAAQRAYVGDINYRMESQLMLDSKIVLHNIGHFAIALEGKA